MATRHHQLATDLLGVICAALWLCDSDLGHVRRLVLKEYQTPIMVALPRGSWQLPLRADGGIQMTMMRAITAGLLCLAACACGESQSSAVDDDREVEVVEDQPSEPEPATTSLMGQGETLGDETYDQYDERRDSLATGLYSGGDECTEDCGGHDAGREWAEQQGIADPSECGGNSWSFVEGCQSYASEQQGIAQDEEEEEAEEY